MTRGGFIPPSGLHDATCAYLCKDVPNCKAKHACKVCAVKARNEGRQLEDDDEANREA